MQQFYKDVIEQGHDSELCAIILKATKITAIEQSALHVLA